MFPLYEFSYTSFTWTICLQLDALQCNSTSLLALTQSCKTCRNEKIYMLYKKHLIFNTLLTSSNSAFNILNMIKMKSSRNLKIPIVKKKKRKKKYIYIRFFSYTRLVIIYLSERSTSLAEFFFSRDQRKRERQFFIS